MDLFYRQAFYRTLSLLGPGVSPIVPDVWLISGRCLGTSSKCLCPGQNKSPQDLLSLASGLSEMGRQGALCYSDRGPPQNRATTRSFLLGEESCLGDDRALDLD